jgi:hypothetical protein
MSKNLDNPNGVHPWGPVLRTQLYAVQTAPTIHMFHGDIVQHGGTSLSTKFGYIPIVEDGDVVATSDMILGSIVGVFDEDMDPVAYIDVGEAGDGTVAGYVMVADHPDQLFIAQEDCDTTPIPVTSSEMNADLIVVALNQGTEETGLSSYEIDSDTAADTATLMIKLHYPHPDDTVPGTSTYHTRWIFTINSHAKDSNIIGKVTQT